MKEIIINDNTVLRAEVVVSNKLVEDENGNKAVVTEGVIKAREYLSINKIETMGFTVDEITINSETFSSENGEIVYSFVAGSIEIHEDFYYDDGEDDADERGDDK